MIYVDKKAHGWGLEVLTQDEIQRIHDSACRVLRETGVYMASKDAQDYMQAFGCDVDRETNIIKIPQSVIDKALDAIPRAPAGYQVPQWGRDGDLVTTIGVGENDIQFSCSGVCTSYLDPYTGERREPTWKDVADTARLCDAIPEIYNYQIAVSAEDVPKELMCLCQEAAILKNYTKVHSNMNESPWIFERMLKMMFAVAGGKEAFREKPFFGYGLDPISPLSFDTNELDMTIMGIKAGVGPCVFTDMQSGATGPATLAGALVVTTAETLAGFVFAQSVELGTPVTMGSSSSTFDMRAMSAPIGSAEHALYSCATTQFAKFYGVGCSAGGG